MKKLKNKNTFIGFIFLNVFIISSFSSCIKKHCNNSFDPETWDSCNYTAFNDTVFNIHILNYNQLPYVDTLYRVTKSAVKLWDKDSVPLKKNPKKITKFAQYAYYILRVNEITKDNKTIKRLDSVAEDVWKGDNKPPKKNTLQNTSYHPVFIAQHALYTLNEYDSSGSTKTLNHLKKIADKLISLSLKQDSAMFFPYTFQYSLHTCIEETMMPPWYSGMAQGQILSVFTRLYEITGDSNYLDASHQIFNSYTRFKGSGHKPWVSCIDKKGYLWLEEYPRDLPCHTLNGMIFGIFGIYDYYRVTKDENAKRLLRASMLTIKRNMHKFRDKDEVSWYCLKHKNFNGKNPFYHKVHIKQLKFLYRITGDEYFNKMADSLYQDTKELHEVES